jgi:hypothetical protein
MSYARRTDANHAEIREGLRRCGYRVFDVHSLPGRLDLDVLAKSGLIVPVEVKQPGEGLTEKEQTYLAFWPGIVVYSVDDALEKLAKFDRIRLVEE